MAEKSRRELLASAWDEEEKTDELETKSEVGESSGTEEGASTDVSAKTDSGTGAEPEKSEAVGKEPPVKEKKVPDPDKQEAKAADKGSREGSVRDVGGKAPNSWTPAEREHWGKVPAEARAAIERREKQIQQELSQTANVRKLSQDLANIIQPHLPIIKDMNTTPLGAIDNLMKTATALYRGNQEQKATIISQLIANYGVDIKTLDAVLSKQPLPKQESYNPNAIPQWAQPLLGFMNEAQQARAQREEEMRQEAEAELEHAKESMPFLDDLREDMADLMEAAAKRNRVVTLQEAYDKAVSLHPEISKIVAQRKAAEAAASSNSSNAVARARKAASTVSGAPAGGRAAGSAKPTTRREHLMQAWEDAAG